MANEIRYTAALEVVKNNITHSPPTAPRENAMAASPALADWSGTKKSAGIMSVATTEEAIPMGDVTSPGMAIFKNLDTTNFISIRAATALADLIKLKPGEVALFRLQATAPFAIADTAACDMYYEIFED
jgi:hypothetical protein